MATKVAGDKGLARKFDNSQSYWWRDKSGKWHYHPANAPKPDGATAATSTKPKPAGIKQVPTQPAETPKPPNGLGSRKPPIRSTGGSSQGVKEGPKNAVIKSASGKIIVAPENAKKVWKSTYEGGSPEKGGKPQQKKAMQPPSPSRRGSAGTKGAGRKQLHDVKGGTKVYDSAASRMLRKKRNQYRP